MAGVGMWWGRQASQESTGCQCGEHAVSPTFLTPLIFPDNTSQHTQTYTHTLRDREQERAHNFKCDHITQTHKAATHILKTQAHVFTGVLP